MEEALKSATSEGGRFNGMLEKMAETPAGKMDILAGKWNNFKVAAGEALMPLMSMALDLANNLMPVVEGFITPLKNGVATIAAWIKNIRENTGGFVDYLNIAREFLGEHIVPLARQLWTTISDMAAKWVTFYQNSELMKDVFWIIYQITGFIADNIKEWFSRIQWTFDNIIMPLLKGIDTMYSIWKTLTFGKSEKDNPSDAGGGSTPDFTNPKFYNADNPFISAKKANETTNSALANIVQNTASNKEAAQRANSDIAGGGQKVVNINVGKFTENMTVSQVHMNESVAEVENIFRELFARVIYQTANVNV